LGISQHISQMTADQLWVAVDKTAAALPDLPNAAARVLCELTLAALVGQLYQRLESAGDHETAMALIKAYGACPDDRSSRPA
jgi:hypothetical protein